MWPIEAAGWCAAEHSIRQEPDFKPVHVAVSNGLLWSYCCSLLNVDSRHADAVAEQLGSLTFRQEWFDSAQESRHGHGDTRTVEAHMLDHLRRDGTSAVTLSVRKMELRGILRRNALGKPHPRVRFEGLDQIISGQWVSMTSCTDSSPGNFVRDGAMSSTEGPLFRSETFHEGGAQWSDVGMPPSRMSNRLGNLNAVWEGDSLPLTSRCPATTGQQNDDAPQKRQLLLEPLLESGRVCSGCFTVGARLEHLIDLLLPFDLKSLSRNLDQVDLHPATCEALSCMQSWDGQLEVSRLRVYVDGSFEEVTDRAGWAVVVLGLTDTGWQWLGYMSEHLHEPGHDRHSGHTRKSAHAAEMVAMLHALSIVAHNDLPSEVVFDAMVAAEVAQGLCYPDAHVGLARATTMMHIIAQHRGSVSYRHVRSHQGDPFNEMADSLAKAASRRSRMNPPLGCMLQDAIREGRLSWLWWVVCDLVHTGVLPPVDDNGVTVESRQHLPRPCFANGAVPGVPSALWGSDRSETHPAKWRLEVATYNATTLKPVHVRQQLDQEFWRAGFAAVGIQEARWRPSETYELGHFKCFCSAAVRGQLGCQLWLNKAARLAVGEDGRESRWNLRSAAILVQKPRLLVVTVQAGNRLFAFIVAHAPTSDAAPDSVVEWWGQLEGAYGSYPGTPCR